MYSNQTSVITKNVQQKNYHNSISSSLMMKESDSFEIDLSIHNDRQRKDDHYHHHHHHHNLEQEEEEISSSPSLSISSCSSSLSSNQENYLIPRQEYSYHHSPIINMKAFNNNNVNNDIHCFYECPNQTKESFQNPNTNNISNNNKKRPSISMSLNFKNEYKDEAYWERRRRNNESAKRSRETRRKKEIETTQRIIFLEQENVKLKTEVNFLREELSRLRENQFIQYLMKKTVI